MSSDRERIRARRPIFGLLAPALAFLSIWYLFPVIRTLTTSFSDPEWGLQNFQRLSTTPAYLTVLASSLLTALGVTICCLVLGYPMAFLLANRQDWLAKLAAVAVGTTFFISYLVRTYAWMALLGRNGIINRALLSAGLIDQPLPLIYNTFAVYVGTTHLLIPFMILSIYGVMRGIDGNLVRAASTLGARPWQSFWQVYLPLSMPGVLAGSILTFVTAAGYYITPALLGGRKNTMIAMLIEEQINKVGNWGFAGAMATVLLVLVTILLAVAQRYLGLTRVLTGLNRR